MSELCLVSWNLCHFSSFIDRGKHIPTLEEAEMQAVALGMLDELIHRVPHVDVYVFQELPKQALIPAFYERFKGYEWEPLGEHLFIWNSVRLTPYRVATDMYTRDIHTSHLVKDVFIRPLATKRFHWQGRIVALTSLHFESTTKEAMEALRVLTSTYRTLYHKRFRDDDSTMHLLVGDYNVNVHRCAPIWEKEWIASGSIRTRTTGGGKGVDWLLMPRKSPQTTDVTQRVIPIRTPKNARKGIPGVSDHHPSVCTISVYSDEEEEEALTNSI
jgi:hypothetical protein